MARKKTKLTFEKRRREMDKKKKRQEKLARKHAPIDPEAEPEVEEEAPSLDDIFEAAIEANRELTPDEKRAKKVEEKEARMRENEEGHQGRVI